MLSILSEPGHPNLLKYYGWGKVNRREMTAQLRCFTGGMPSRGWGSLNCYLLIYLLHLQMLAFLL